MAKKSVKAHITRLPPISVELTLLITAWEVQRDMFGMAFCHDTLIGAVRRKLGPIPDIEPPLDFAELARDEARATLAGTCHACPLDDCPMKLWPMA